MSRRPNFEGDYLRKQQGAKIQVATMLVSLCRFLYGLMLQ